MGVASLWGVDSLGMVSQGVEVWCGCDLTKVGGGSVMGVSVTTSVVVWKCIVCV